MAKQKDLVSEFEDAYAGILTEAEQAAETTKTDAWHAMYQRFQEDAKTEAIDIAKGLDGLASASRAVFITTDSVELFGKLKKRFTELHERMEAFKASTVNPIKLPWLPHTKDQRVLACIETAERWAKGKATIAELREARVAAADAADAAAYAAARTRTLKACAGIVRKHYPKPPKVSRRAA
jgi:hypothetical protein